MNKSLDVYCGGQMVGTLSVDDFENYAFTYSSGWLQSASAYAVGYVLPLQAEPHKGPQVHNFFANLLPEGRVREIIERQLHTGHSDFALLWELGRDVAGVLSLVPQGEAPGEETPAYRPAGAKSLRMRLQALGKAPILTGDERCSLSLAGAQDKLNVLHRGNRFLLPLNGAPTNCILKIASRDYPDIVFNEYLCMGIASAAGLPCPAVSLVRPDGMRALAVERFDRAARGDGGIVRLHQQDFCQLLGLSHKDKYEYWGGPSLKQCADVLREVSTLPVVDAELLGKWYTFNLLIGNMDGHAKNISVLRTPRGWRLAPFYDIVHTLGYPGLGESPAMNPAGGEMPLRDITGRVWLDTMSAIGLKQGRATAWMRELCAATLAACARIGIRAPLTDAEKRTVARLVKSIRRNAEAVASRLAEV